MNSAVGRRRAIFTRCHFERGEFAMQEAQWTDEHLLLALTSADVNARNRALHFLYRNPDWRKPVQVFVLQSGGSMHDTKDVFQDAIIDFEKALRSQTFRGESSLHTFFMSIARRKWWSMLRSRKPTDGLDSAPEKGPEQTVEDLFILAERKQLLSEALSRLGKRCKRLLMLYQLSYSMEEIAVEASMGSAGQAKNETHRCRKRLRRFLEERPHWKSLFD